MWVEGNLPAGSKCTVCQRACGSLMKLQDFRCVWCKWTVSPDVPTFLPYYSGRCSRERKNVHVFFSRPRNFFSGDILLREHQSVRVPAVKFALLQKRRNFLSQTFPPYSTLQHIFITVCDVWCECVMWTCNPRSTPSARIRLKRRVRWEISNCPSCRRLLSSDLTPSGKECGRYIICTYCNTIIWWTYWANFIKRFSRNWFRNQSLLAATNQSMIFHPFSLLHPFGDSYN